MDASSAELVVVGRACAEYMARGSWLPKSGETVDATSFEATLGGWGARQAVAAARLERLVALVTPIGADDRAECLLRWLGAEAVDTRLVRRDEKTSSGAALVQVGPHGARQRMVFPEAGRAVGQLDVEAAADAIARARGLLLSLELPPAVAQRAIMLAREAGVRVLLDTTGATTPSAELLRAVDVVHVTPRETELLIGVRVLGPATARTAGEALAARGPGAVVLEAGADGHRVATERGSRLFPRLGVPEADDEIAAEAFVAGLAVGLVEARSLDDASILASAARALVSAEQGVRAFPRRDAVLRLLEASTRR